MPRSSGWGYPRVVSGFALPDSNVHAPNERMLVSHLGHAVNAARELFRSLGALDA